MDPFWYLVFKVVVCAVLLVTLIIGGGAISELVDLCLREIKKNVEARHEQAIEKARAEYFAKSEAHLACCEKAVNEYKRELDMYYTKRRGAFYWNSTSTTQEPHN